MQQRYESFSILIEFKHLISFTSNVAPPGELTRQETWAGISRYLTSNVAPPGDLT